MNFYIRLTIALFFLINSFSVHAQIKNIELIANVEIEDSATDIWGFVDEQGVEYAIMAGQLGVYIFSLENPSEPKLIKYIKDDFTKWRDVKSYKNRIYVSSETINKGLMIINMSDPKNITYKYWKSRVEINDKYYGFFRNCHNVYIDTNTGYAFLAASKLSNKGVLILDLNKDLDNPECIGIADDTYSHDAYVHNDLLFTSEIYEGVFGIYDISDITNPVRIGEMDTTSKFTHNAWTDDTGNYLFTTDEKPGSFVESYDISDPTNPIRLNKYRPYSTYETGSVPHNTHYKDGYLYTSWYTDGVVVTDAHDPENLIEVAQYDTFNGSNEEYMGCWGVYPFLPSGLLIASDRQTGLYVLKANVSQPAYLKGKVTDSVNGREINNVRVEFVEENKTVVTSNAEGEYKTGLSDGGIKKVKFSHDAYIDVVLPILIKKGEYTEFNVEMISDKYSKIDSLSNHPVLIYPNPVHDKLNIDTQAELKNVHLFDNHGSFIGKTLFSKSIDMSDLPNGLYILKLEDNNESKVVRKIIKY